MINSINGDEQKLGFIRGAVEHQIKREIEALVEEEVKKAVSEIENKIRAKALVVAANTAVEMHQRFDCRSIGEEVVIRIFGERR